MHNTLLKYAGNKRSYMNQIAAEFNWGGIHTFVDPFCGALGAALNCDVFNKQIQLSDINWEIINLYTQVRDQPQQLEIIFNSMLIDETTYYEIRDWDRDSNWRSRNLVELAARTLYLNKHCFNGLFRINGNGNFNVPWNKSLRDVKLNLVADHQHTIQLLNTATLSCDSYSNVMLQCKAGTLIYCDPPYVDTNINKRSFSGYMGGFDMGEQTKLRDIVVVAASQGVKVYVSNSDCDVTRKLYSCAKRIVDITGVKRSLSCSSAARGRVNEILACFD